jgi:hypothetical protein
MVVLLWLEMGGGGWMSLKDLIAGLRGVGSVVSVFMGDPELFSLLGWGSFGVASLPLGLAVEGGVEATWEYVSIMVGDGEMVSVLRVGLGVAWVGVVVGFVGEFFVAVFCDLSIIFCMSCPPFGSLSLDALFGGIVDSSLGVLPAVIALEN